MAIAGAVVSDTETETTLCADCHVPVDAPKVVQFHPLFTYTPVPLCKDCLWKARMAQFDTLKFKACPYKIPHWRPQR